MIRSLKYQKVLSDLQPKIQEIQKKYNGDREKQTKELVLLYQKEKINPFSGFLFLLIQLPILIALYQVFWKGLRPEAMVNLYNFISNPGALDPTFFGMINLAQPSLALAVLAGITQFYQTKMLTPKTPKRKQDQMTQFSEMMQKQMLYFLPIFTAFILWRLPAAIGLYWIVTVLFSILQQYLIYSKKNVQ